MYFFSLKPILMFGAMVVVTSACFAQEQEALTLADAVAQVRAQNPSLAASRFSAQAAAQMPTQAYSLADPVLTLGASALPTDTFSTKQEAMTQLSLGISQAFPFPGKLGDKVESESYMAEAIADGVDEQVLQLISQVKISWWHVLYLDKALETVAHNQQLLRQLIQIAESKYKVGKGLQQDVLLAQMELSKLLDEKIQLDAKRQMEVIRLNTLFNRPANQALLLSSMVDAHLPELGDTETLITTALRSRPRLTQQDKLISAANARVSLADKAYYPDFKLGASYGWRGEDAVTGIDRPDLASLSLTMTMPFFSSGQHDAELQQRQAEKMRESFKYQDVQNAVVADISRAITQYEKSKAQVSLLQSGLIPQAKQTVASMFAAYQVNKVDFLNLVRAQVTLYNYETQYWKVFAEANQALAQLDAAIGKDVPND